MVAGVLVGKENVSGACAEGTGTEGEWEADM